MRSVYDAYDPGIFFTKNPRSFSATPVAHPLPGQGDRPHVGDDYGTQGVTGVGISSAADGVVVINSENEGGWGHYVVIEHTSAMPGVRSCLLPELA